MAKFLYFENPSEGMAHEDIQLQKKLLLKLLKNKVLGSYHLRLQTILSGMPRHQVGELKQSVYDLLQKGFLIWYNKSKQAIQLNKDRLEDIRRFLEE